MVIAGRRTIEDFPGKQPLPGRVNVALSRSGAEIPGFTVCDSAEKARALSRTAERCFVIGGGSVYQQMLPFCDAAYVTKVHVTPESDTFFPNLDEDKDWYLGGNAAIRRGKTALPTKCACIEESKNTLPLETNQSGSVFLYLDGLRFPFACPGFFRTGRGGAERMRHFAPEPIKSSRCAFTSASCTRA